MSVVDELTHDLLDEMRSLKYLSASVKITYARRIRVTKMKVKSEAVPPLLVSPSTYLFGVKRLSSTQIDDAGDYIYTEETILS